MKWLALKIAQELVHIYRGATMVYLWAIDPSEEHKARVRLHVDRLQDRISRAKDPVRYRMMIMTYDAQIRNAFEAENRREYVEAQFWATMAVAEAIHEASYKICEALARLEPPAH